VGHSSSAVFFDFNRDGLLDCFLTNVGRYTSEKIGKDQGHTFCAGKSGIFHVSGTLGTRTAALIDFDDDGDLVTNDFGSEPQVLMSNLAQRSTVNHIKVQLIGSRSNRDGIGAVVKVHAGDQAYTRLMDGNSGYLSQSSMPLYFGLGSTTRIDRVEVSWPSGVDQIVTDGIELNELLVIEEPASSGD
jgi:hypothetical protein